MKLLSYLFIVFTLSALAGCKTLNFTFHDPKPTGSQIVLPIETNVQSSAIFIWLPPAFKNEFASYTNAFTKDADSYFLQQGISNQHSEDQALFNANAAEYGGIFDSRTGRLDKDTLNLAIKKTATELFGSHPDAQVILFITPYKETVPLFNGFGQWSNIEQKQSTVPGDSSESRRATSLRLNYLLRDGQPQLHNIGLDMQDERFAEVGKYKHIVEYVFKPVFKKARDNKTQ